MSRIFTFIISIVCFTAVAQPPVIQTDHNIVLGNDSQLQSMPYLKNCKNFTNDEERNTCTVDELLNILKSKFECPWRDLEGETSNIILRFMVNDEGGLERFLTLYSDNAANRPSEAINNALIRAVYATNGQWVPVREGGKTIPREYLLPVSCNCSDQAKPSFILLDTIPAYYSDGHYQLESFIEKHIFYPEGFLSKSGRQTTALLKALISKEGKLDSTTIRVLNLNQIDYRLSENAINILLALSRRSWKPALAKGIEPIDYTLYFKVTYIDDKNPRRGSIQTEWDITVGNNHFFNDGAFEFDNKNYTAAIELFKRAVFLDPDDKESWLMLGQSYLGAREKSAARAALERAAALGHTEAEKWMAEAEKPDEIEPKLPAKEVIKRPARTEKIRPATYHAKPEP